MSDTIPDSSPQKQCKDCNEYFPATKEFFTPYAKMRDGLRNTCKKCRQEKRRTTEILPEGHKRCTKCKHLLPATTDFFFADTAGKFGLRGQCKVCCSPHVNHRPAPEGYKRCTLCKKIFPATPEFFHTQKEGKFGLRAACKSCRNEEGREYGKVHVRHRKHRNRKRFSSYPEQYKQRMRAKARANYRIHVEYHKRYRETHRAERNAHNHNREARKRLAPGTLTDQQIQQKLKAQKYRCYYSACGYAKFKKENGKYIYHIEHTIPLSRTEAGPRHDVNYVVLACPTCNLSKHDKLLSEWPEGGRLF